MRESQAVHELEVMAGEIFDLTKIASTARARARSGNPEELTEAEFLTLDLLTQQELMCVGDIQKRIGVLPAQMSRIVRALEDKGGEAFVSCGINPVDRRKIDVNVTPKGRNAHRAYRAARLKFTVSILKDLQPEDRKQFMRILRDIRASIARGLSRG